MPHSLSAASLRVAIRHVCRFGDTDLFPHLPEIAFLREREQSLIEQLTSLDLDTYVPGSAFEALVPKSRYGFRIAHQLQLLDTVLLLASVIEIAPAIEARRLGPNGTQTFSYRFKVDKHGGIFRGDRTYKNWLNAQMAILEGDTKIQQVVSTDISDFYARLNFHRLENLLDEVAPGNGCARYIKKHIKTIRAKQSFGLPVGGSAARLLAELCLSDTDRALHGDGARFTRFVDDFRMFLRADQSPYDALAFLAEQLGLEEGLSLNGAKTRVSTREGYLKHLETLVTDFSHDAQAIDDDEEALDALVADLYFDDAPDPDDLEKLKGVDLLGLLQKEAQKEAFDMGRIRVIFRGLKLVKPVGAVAYLSEHFRELVVFAREMTLLMQALEHDAPGCFSTLGSTVVKAILASPASSVQLIRSWLIELFVRGTVPITTVELKELSKSLSSALDQRQLNFIRGRVGDQSHFRKLKTKFGELSLPAQSSVIWGAACLPKDEYRKWLEFIKPMYPPPIGASFLQWAESEQKQLMAKLNSFTDEQQE